MTFRFHLDIMIKLGCLHTTQEKFENAALFLRLGLLSTLFHQENGALLKLALKTDLCEHKSEMTENCCVFKFPRCSGDEKKIDVQAECR